MIGQTLSHFKITAKLGEGGMGEVYRAEDTKLGREVAIKVLPEAVASDSERLARFEREAKVLASLNHPNIAAIYAIESAERAGTEARPYQDDTATADVGEGHGALPVHFLVMELAEGADLTQHIAQGPMLLERALPMALQIAEALEAADERGIVHRDLKPANVKVTADGKIKVLDFGLAKALDPGGLEEGGHDLSMSPTLTAQMTQAGVLLGTAAYMSPEQARGEPVDRRSDIWAFGIVLMEMLTGERVFAGRTVSDTLAGVLAREPNWEALPADLPMSIRRLLERCLEKETRDRLQAIGEARLVIERYLADPNEPSSEAAGGDQESSAVRRPLLPWVVAGLATLVALAAVLWNWGSGSGSEAIESPSVLRASILPPEGHSWWLDGFRPGRVAISPDGRQVAYAVAAEGQGEPQLWVQPLDSTTGRPLPNTEGAGYPFWSPDGQYLAFFTGDKLKKIAVTGGPPVSLVDANNGKSGSWNHDGTIVYAASARMGLFRIPAAGGDSVAVTELDPETGDNSHRHPVFLPDGQHFLYLARRSGEGNQNTLRIGSLDGSVGRDLVATPTNAAYADGKLLFIREGTLMAQPFNLESLELEGEPRPLIENVMEVGGAALSVFSVSETGILAYQSGDGAQQSQLVWKDRSGRETGELGDPVEQIEVTLSRDGSMAVVVIETDDQEDLWLYDAARNLRTRFTFNEADDISPAISPQGDRIVFASDRGGQFNLYLRAMGGTAESELLTSSDGFSAPYAWTVDGEIVLYADSSASWGSDLYAVPVGADQTPIQLTDTEFSEGHPTVSPDGRWLAYTSDESGEWEVYVTTFPKPERKWQVSTGGGDEPRWSRNGYEVVYRSPSVDALIAVEVEVAGDTLQVGKMTKLFESGARSDRGRGWDVTADGERFLINKVLDQGRVSPLHLAVNWPAILGDG